MNKFILGFILYGIGHTMVWFSGNGQFIWKWFNDHPILVACSFGILNSYVFIIGTKHIVNYYDGLLWPGRFIGFSIGIFIFYLLTYVFFKEGINLKTTVSIFLALVILLIQLFWK